MNCQFWEHLDGDGVEDKIKKVMSYYMAFCFSCVSFIIDYVTNLILQLFFQTKGEKYGIHYFKQHLCKWHFGRT